MNEHRLRMRVVLKDDKYRQRDECIAWCTCHAWAQSKPSTRLNITEAHKEHLREVER